MEDKRALSDFGQLIRGLRLRKDMLLSDMADQLGVSPSYLSAVDFGRRPVPKDWPDKIAKILDLSAEQLELLRLAAADSTNRARGAITVELSGLTPMQEEVALQFARVLKKLSDDELAEVRRALMEERLGEQKWRSGSR
jgi:transcriptional regulator with XRE-family HTH domain